MAKITIEIAGPRNEQYMWPVTLESLRGRWKASSVAHHDKSDALKAVCALESIPGLYVWIDTRKKSCGIYDPLGFDENGEVVSDAGRRKFKRWEVIQKEHSTRLSAMQPWPAMVFEPRQGEPENEQNSRLKEWIYHMRRAVDQGYAEYVDGSPQLPPIDEIVKLPGRIKNEPFNQGQKGKGIPEYRFDVPASSAT